MKDNIQKPNLLRAVDQIFLTQQNEIACDEAGSLIAQFVDNQKTAADLNAFSPELSRHLNVCIDCAAEYQMVQAFGQLAALPAEGQVASIPARPDRPGIVKQLQDAFDSIFNFPGFETAQASAVRGSGMDVETVEISLNPEMNLEIDVALHPNNPALRDVYISITVEDEEKGAELEGVAVWLAEVGSESQVASTMLDKYGEAVLSAVEPNVDYFMQIDIPAQVSRVQQIRLPLA